LVPVTAGVVGSGGVVAVAVGGAGAVVAVGAAVRVVLYEPAGVGGHW
jgi:hypothetical protein